ncbi:MAG: hypothetical protein ACR2IN_09875 [Thermoleophilaceae bacterium]|jgi:hypothetical protein
MRYPVDNALFQWEEGERRLRDAPELERIRLERAAAAVLEELRRRLGSSFTVEELADLYGGDPYWAGDVAAAAGAPGDASWVVDASFARYVREAANFGGGRRRGDSERF